MKTLYFTYGSEGHPFRGGWTEITVPDDKDAVYFFNVIHPPTRFMACAGVYTEEDFKRTRMYEQGNLGAFCWERITIERFDGKEN